MTEEKYEVTREHFQQYQAFVQRFVREFGLLDWLVYFEHEELNGALGELRTNVPGRVCTFVLNTIWKCTRPTPDELERCAFHEVIHLRLARLAYLANHRCASHSELDEEEEGLVRWAETVLLPCYTGSYDESKQRMLGRIRRFKSSLQGWCS